MGEAVDKETTIHHVGPDMLMVTSDAVFEIKGTPQSKGPRAPYLTANAKENAPAKSETPYTNEPWHLWGTNDDHPTVLSETIEGDTVLAPGMNFLSAMAYGGGVAHGEIQVDDRGNEYFRHLRDFGKLSDAGRTVVPGFVQFMRANNLDHQVFTTLKDVSMLNLAFVQLTLNRERTRIVGYNVEHTRAKNCRYSQKMNGGRPKYVMMSADFGTAEFEKSKVKKLELAPSYDPVTWIRDRVSASKSFRTFAVEVRVPDTGRMFYPTPAWTSVRTSGWNDIAKSLASYKKHLLKNQMTIKYHIVVHPEFWRAKFGAEWDKFTPDEKRAKKEGWLKDFKEFMASEKGTGNTLLSEKVADRYQADKYADTIEIKPIANLIKDGMHVEDSQEASRHHMSATGLHVDLMGGVPGSQMSAGSGSNARVAFNQRVAMSKFVQDAALYPLGIVRDFNRWDQNMVFRMRNSLITTLDTGASATEPTANT